MSAVSCQEGSLLSGFCFLASKFYSSEEVDMSLGKHKLSKLTQEEINNLSSPLSSVEIRFGGENTSLRENPRPGHFPRSLAKCSGDNNATSA